MTKLQRDHSSTRSFCTGVPVSRNLTTWRAPCADRRSLPEGCGAYACRMRRVTPASFLLQELEWKTGGRGVQGSIEVKGNGSITSMHAAARKANAASCN